MEELLSLKWNNHQSSFIHALSILRDKQLFTDTTLACDGKFYSVHKLVLSTCSDYFSTMLDRINCKNPLIVLADVKCENLEALLDYMYLGEVNVRQGDLAALIKTAECLRVKGLAVPDDDLPNKNIKESHDREMDVDCSPPTKRKRYEEAADNVNQDEIGHSSHNRPKTPSSLYSSHSPVHNRTNSNAPPTEINTSLSRTNAINNENLNHTVITTVCKENYESRDIPSEEAHSFVKIEMENNVDNEVETHSVSCNGMYKLEGEDRTLSTIGEREQSEQLGQAMVEGSTNINFSGTLFQPGDVQSWQSEGLPLLKFDSTEDYVQQSSAEGIASAAVINRETLNRCNSRAPAPANMDLGSNSCSSTQVSLTGLGENIYSVAYEHKCQFCGKSFVFASKLREHLRSHTGERPYKCEVCEYRATLSGTLRRHVKTVHNKEGPVIISAGNSNHIVTNSACEVLNHIGLSSSSAAAEHI